MTKKKVNVCVKLVQIFYPVLAVYQTFSLHVQPDTEHPYIMSPYIRVNLIPVFVSAQRTVRDVQSETLNTSLSAPDSRHRVIVGSDRLIHYRLSLHPNRQQHGQTNLTQQC